VELIDWTLEEFVQKLLHIMAISLASTSQTLCKVHLEASCSRKQLSRPAQSVQNSLSWRTKMSPSLWTKMIVASRTPRQLAKEIGRLQCRAETFKVEVEFEGKKHMLDVPEGETILSVAIEAGLEVPYDCQLGVCMTCPAKLESGIVDQDIGMLSDDVVAQGYALMCVAVPKSDCSIRAIPEEELLALQLATADD
jgi:ferredoxin